MVFQFPVHGFPENGPVHEMGDYEHFRPYLHTKNLRFSYGTVKGRKGSDWQAKLDDNKPLEVTSELAAKGFGHVLINRRAYLDQGVGLKSRFETAGMREIMQNKDFFLFEIGSDGIQFLTGNSISTRKPRSNEAWCEPTSVTLIAPMLVLIQPPARR